jgi:hypothetical protein
MDETWQSGKISAVIAGLKTEITEDRRSYKNYKAPDAYPACHPNRVADCIVLSARAVFLQQIGKVDIVGRGGNSRIKARNLVDNRSLVYIKDVGLLCLHMPEDKDPAVSKGI